MKPVKFHLLAEQELAESVNFYNDRISGLGDEFFLAIKSASRYIQRHPLRRAPKPAGTRKLIITRFPYTLIYREQPEWIEIIAVVHAARRPDYWGDRL